MRTRSSLVVLIVVVVLAGGAIGWYLLSPLFITHEVAEGFPTPEGQATAEPQAVGPMPGTPTAAMVEPTPAGEVDPVLLAAGEFYPIAHEGEGTATIYQLTDGSRVLRFEAFEVLNGPDLHVWLVPLDLVPNTVGVEIEGYVDLGELKGNVGDQNYELPPELDLGVLRSVVVWCVPFRVPFAAAPLRAP